MVTARRDIVHELPLRVCVKLVESRKQSRQQVWQRKVHSSKAGCGQRSVSNDIGWQPGLWCGPRVRISPVQVREIRSHDSCPCSKTQTIEARADRVSAHESMRLSNSILTVPVPVSGSRIEVKRELRLKVQVRVCQY